MKNGPSISEEIIVADAHPSGKRPFERNEYINKFKNLTEGIITKNESFRFLKLVQNLKKLSSKELNGLNIEISGNKRGKTRKIAIFS